MLIVTYNIQWGMGRDRRIDLSRIAETVAAADVIALQEVERHWRAQDFPDQAARLAELLPGFDWVYGAAVDLRGGTGLRRQIGNMILSRAPIESTRTLPLPSFSSRKTSSFTSSGRSSARSRSGGSSIGNTLMR